MPYYGKDNDDYVNGQGFCCDDTPKTKSFAANDNPELYQYYYHSDHLGSSSLITNLDGETVQHIEYVPFGEVFIEERNNTWNTPYLFNAKELDEETGLYYYGARYYDSRVSIFYGVDPLAEKDPNKTPYHYCSQNPVNRIDPDGKDDYIDEKGKWLYNDNKTSSDIKFMKRSDWNVLNEKFGKRLYDRSKTYRDIDEALADNSKLITVEDASGKFSQMWKETVKDNAEKTGYILLDLNSLTITFERYTKGGDVDAQTSHGKYYWGQRYEGSMKIVLGNVHSHADEHTYLGKKLVGGGIVTDRYNFENQFKTLDGDGRTSILKGSTYTISKYNIDFFRGDRSINNIMKRKNLEGSKGATDLLKHTMIEYGKYRR